MLLQWMRRLRVCLQANIIAPACLSRVVRRNPIVMEASDIQRIVREEVSRGEAFNNSHGITPQNVRQFLVPPFSVRTDPDDTESPPRDMWVVLQERPQGADGYAVVYDPQVSGWGVVERAGTDYVLVCAADSLASALTSM